MPNITLDGTEIRAADGSIHSWLERGLWGPAEYRGTNTVVPGKAGEEARPLIAARRLIVMPTVLKAATESDLLTLDATLTALWIATQAAPKELRVYGPLYGIAAGAYRRINVRFLNAIPQWLTARQMVRYSAEYVSIDSPPDWVQVGP